MHDHVTGGPWCVSWIAGRQGERHRILPRVNLLAWDFFLTELTNLPGDLSIKWTNCLYIGVLTFGLWFDKI